jgi:hypothetical protein
VLPTSERTFLVFAIQTLPEYFEQLRPVLEASFNSVAIRSAEQLANEKLQRLDVARNFLGSLTPQKLRSLIGLNQWTRIYQPASASMPETEKGYSVIDVSEAKRGVLDPAKDEKNYTGIENKLGLLVKVQGRLLIDPQRNIVYDSIAMYWMAWDQSEEAWSVRGTKRQGEAEQTEAETGVRTAELSGNPPRLSVILARNVSDTREPSEWAVPDVYLSQPISWLLSRVLPRDITSPQQYSWYFYSYAGAKSQMTLRLDTWEPTSDGSDTFTLTTRMSSDTLPVVSVYRKDGSLLRRTHGDGVITETTTLEDLRRIWKSKNLPMGSKSRR